MVDILHVIMTYCYCCHDKQCLPADCLLLVYIVAATYECLPQ
jgi:hypothetical protein